MQVLYILLEKGCEMSGEESDAKIRLKKFLRGKEGVVSYSEIKEFLEDAGFATDHVAVEIAIFGSGARAIPRGDGTLPRVEDRDYRLEPKATRVTTS